MIRINCMKNLFSIKSIYFKKAQIEATNLNIIKIVYDTPTVNIIFNERKPSITTKIIDKTTVPTFSDFFSI